MIKQKKKLLIIFATTVILLILCFQLFFDILTYNIVLESIKNNSNYYESKYNNYISQEYYEQLNFFRGHGKTVNGYTSQYIEESYKMYYFIAVFTDIRHVTVHYMYSCEVNEVIPSTKTKLCGGSWWVPCTVVWELQSNGAWKIVERTELT